MKSFAILFAVLAITAQCQDLTDLWQTWKQQMGKTYTSDAEEQQRYNAFVNNYNFIVEYNAQNTGTILGLTIFADLTNEEFAASRYCMDGEEMILAHRSQEPIPFDETTSVPTSVDWRQKGAVTSIKNQGQCGGCWSFAAAAGLESLWFIQGNQLTSFSEQQLIDCATSCSGCNGCDNLYNALVYTSQQGIESLADYPFTGTNGRCKYDASDVVFKNTGYTNVSPNNANALMAAIAQQPTLVGIEADQNVFQLYSGGVITKDCGASLDHAVTAVGYGTYDNQSAWIVKNSWGTQWGVQGYVYISTASANDGAGVCGILSCPTYPTQV